MVGCYYHFGQGPVEGCYYHLYRDMNRAIIIPMDRDQWLAVFITLDRGRWRAVLNKVINIRTPSNSLACEFADICNGVLEHPFLRHHAASGGNLFPTPEGQYDVSKYRVKATD